MNSVLDRLESMRLGIAKRPWLAVLLVWLDLLLLNIIAFQVTLQTLLGHLTGFALLGAGLGLSALIALTHALLDNGLPKRRRRLVLELLCPALAMAFLIGLQGVQHVAKGVEFNFITTELVKLPFWIYLLATSCPYFTTLFALGALATTICWRVAPTHKLVQRLPRYLVWAFSITVVYKLAFSYTGEGIEGFISNGSQALLYLFIFASAPGALVWFGRRGYLLLASRLIPSSWILITLFLNYTGVVPLYGWGELAFTSDTTYIEENKGVRVIAEPPEGGLGRSFNFLRQIQRTPDRLFASYGPSCGILSVDLLSRQVDHLHIPGLFRDMQMLDDPYRLWAANWRQGDLILVDPISFEIACTIDVFAQDIPKPYHMAWDGETLYLTNLNPPRLFETKVTVSKYNGGTWRGGPAKCDLEIVRMLDFHEIGYTPYQDAAHYSYFHKPTGKIYVSIGVLEDTYLMGMAEVDIHTWEVTGDIRLPAGGIFFIEETDTFILPSFYYGKMWEVRREDLSVIRELDADPRSFKLAFDPQRRLIYAASRITGTVRVIDYATGETLHRLPVGAKSEPLDYDEEKDVLYTGGASGIVQIKLDELLGPRSGVTAQ